MKVLRYTRSMTYIPIDIGDNGLYWNETIAPTITLLFFGCLIEELVTNGLIHLNTLRKFEKDYLGVEVAQ